MAKLDTAKIKYRIYQLGTSQKQIAEKVKTASGKSMAYNNFSDTINNRVDVRLSTVGRIAEALDMEPGDIVVKDDAQ